MQMNAGDYMLEIKFYNCSYSYLKYADIPAHNAAILTSVKWHECYVAAHKRIHGYGWQKSKRLCKTETKP